MGLGRIVAAFALVLALLPGPAGAQAGRTPFDRLDLATPESAVAQFTAAWRSRDYVTAYWILAPSSQDTLYRTVWIDLDLSSATTLPGGWGGSGETAMPPELAQKAKIVADGVTAVAVPAPKGGMLQGDRSWLFDQLMLAVDKADVSPLHLPDQDGALQSKVVGDEAAIVLGAGAGAVTFHLLRLPGGQWRVISAMGVGRNPDLPPWGLGDQK